MLVRIGVVAQNTYREAVRARILHGLLGLALATAGYCLIVGQFALKSTFRVVSDLGAASISLYGVVVAIVLGATSLHRELELKTVFPILARPIRRWEYVVGKFLGAVLTLAVFIAANAGVLLLSLAILSSTEYGAIAGGALGICVASALAAWKLPRMRLYVPLFAAFAILALSWPLAAGAPDDRRVILGSAALSLGEVAVVSAIATFFSAFSSPFLTAVFTFGIFVVGRSADTLARLPERFFGAFIHDRAVTASKIVPNLMVYVPPRTLLTGEAAGTVLGPYLALAEVQALAWSVGLLAAAALIFQRRDFL
jgi:ABC-type transport system involved in multi-copper enzyme maturation permease subunit